MRLNRLVFLLRHDLKVVRRVKWRIAEIVYFPLTTIVIWGFYARASPQGALAVALAVLAVNVLWNFAAVAQSTTNLQILEDIWSGSLRQVLLTGVTPSEYAFARIVFAMLLALPLGGVMLAVSIPFGLTVHGMHAEAALCVLAAAVSSAALALLVAGGIFTLGKEYGFLAWTLMQIFVLFSAPFHEPEVFPGFLRTVSRFMPFTDAFAIARRVAAGLAVERLVILKAFAVGAAYMAAGVPLYLAAFARARRTGLLAKL